jgi:anti-sigma regulatory factor (Ser/Thr protein kinase)
MTMEESALTVAVALQERAAIVRRRAATLRSDAAGLATVVSDLRSRRHDRSYSAEASSVPQARAGVAAFAAQVGVTRDQLEGIQLAVSEAVSNAVMHAYPDQRGELHVFAAVFGGRLTVLITDDGCGPHVPSQRPGLGCGLALMAASSDRFTIRELRCGGTAVHMRWRIA